MKSLQALVELLLSKTVLRLVGLAIFAGVLWTVDFQRVLDVGLEASLLDIGMGLLLTIPIVLIRAFRWNRIKHFLDLDVRYRFSSYLQVVGQMAFLTPGKVGEFIKAFYLKGDGHSLGRSVVSIIGDRLFDVIVVVVITGIAAVYFFPTVFLVSDAVPLMMVMVIVLTLGLGFVYRGSLYDIGYNLFLTALPDWLEVKVDRLIESFKDYLGRTTSTEVLVLFALSLFAFATQVFRIFFFAKSLSITVPVLPLAGVIAIMSFSNMLPISFLGLGTRDAVFLYFFGLLGVMPERAIGLSLLVLASLIINTAIGSLLFVFQPPAVNVGDYLANEGSTESE